jgi:DNA primase
MGKLIINDEFILNTPIYDILQRLQVTLTNGKLKDIKNGTENIVVTCPDHAGGHESKPACNIYVGPENPKLEYGYFNCFACGSRGNFLKFVAHCFGTSEEYAKNWLLKNFETEVIPKAFYLGDPIVVGKKKPRKKFLDEAILDQYQTWTPYLGQRKLSRAVCELFKVRYDPHARQVIFPAYDVFGRLVMTPKRSIDTKTFYLDKDVEKPVYCLDYIIKNNISTAMICEGPFDVLTCYTYGYPAIGTFGNPSPYQIEAINRSPIKVLYLAMDNDVAGRRMANTIRAGLDPRIIIKEVHWPNGHKDPNELGYEEFQQTMEKAKNS